MIARRLITNAEYYRVRCKPGSGSVLLTLECGHSVTKKRSAYAKLKGPRVACGLCTAQIAKQRRAPDTLPL